MVTSGDLVNNREAGGTSTEPLVYLLGDGSGNRFRVAINSGDIVVIINSSVMSLSNQ